MTLGQRIAELRADHALNQIQLAKKLNIGTSTLGMWETDKRRPSTEALVKLADLFGTSTDYLLGRTAVKSRPDDPALEPRAAHRIQGLSPEKNKQVDDFIKFLNSQSDADSDGEK